MKQKLNKVSHSSCKKRILSKIILMKTLLIKTFCTSDGRNIGILLVQTEKVNRSNTDLQN